MIGVEFDAGTLVTKWVENAGKTEVTIVLRGMYLTLEQSKRAVKKIIN